jgi:predicted MFS family arabinose efflux permease
MSPPAELAAATRAASPRLPTVVIVVIAFLTLVDLFAAQAILPALAAHYGTTPAATGLAVNATTAGMAVGSLAVAILGAHVDRRLGVIASLCLLAIPTALLSVAPNLGAFGALRVAQGLCMASAFALTLAYLGENTSPEDVAGTFSAYITGNVASNLCGRLLAAFLVDHYGLAPCFLVFAALNLAGAVLVAATLDRMPRMAAVAAASPMASWLRHLGSPRLAAAFGVGFCILFAFVGGFTYVNFVLARPPLALGMMQIGLVYFVFVPSVVTTPLAGRLVARSGPRAATWLGLGLALIGSAALLVPNIGFILTGLTLFAVGTFFAQAVATGFVGKAAKSDRGSAAGLYLCAYFLGGLAGSALLGLAFDSLGWNACVLLLDVALLTAMVLSRRFIVDP